MVTSEQFVKAFMKGRLEEVRTIVQGALDAGEKAETLLNQGLIKAMDQIGHKFSAGEIYIPEMLVAARAMHAGLAILKPILSKSTASIGAKVVLGTVKGDLHDIGKNLVGMMLEGGGFEIVDVGIDVSAEKFVQAAKDHKAKVIGMSALLTTTMNQMNNVIHALKESGLGDHVRTIVGGAPVTAQFAKKIGADGFAPDAAAAVDTVRKLVGLK
ncbi:MAG: corrinoid protein [Thermodesulfobacteriota bacterium]|jgi:5-methyltetrahydrofolate--homocysteine methyltransferase